MLIKEIKRKTVSCSKSFSTKFKLSKGFVDEYRKRKVAFGFNGLGEIAYLRTYSRKMDDGRNEHWVDTVERIVNGCFNMQKEFKEGKFDHDMSMILAMRMFDKIFNFKFLPPGRGLWAMGTLNNCAFVSTEMQEDSIKSDPFTFLMNSSMLGVGVGFDTKGANKIKIFKPQKDSVKLFEIPDSREGWVESIKLLLDSYFEPNMKTLEFNYSKIRQKGVELSTFGGVSSGPEPLITLHEMIRKKLDGIKDEDYL